MNDYSVPIIIVLLIVSFLGYALKRNFDENALYVQLGYHQVSGTNSTWVK